MAESKKVGVQEQRIAEKLEEGNYYEYTQLIKTVFFKYKMRKRHQEMQALIKNAIQDLGKHKQPQLVGDIFDIYFKEHVQKMQKTVKNPGEIEDAFLFEICKLTHANAEKKRGIELITKVVDICVSKEFNDYNMQLCGIIAQYYINEEKIYTSAYSFSLRSGNVEQAMLALDQLMKQAYMSEYDMFVTRLCLEVIIRNKTDKQGLDQALMIIKRYREDKSFGKHVIIDSPLLNFITIIVEVIKDENFDMFKMILNIYGKQLNRDPQFREYLDRIARYYFDGKTIKPPDMMKQMMQNMFKGGGLPFGGAANSSPEKKQ